MFPEIGMLCIIFIAIEPDVDCVRLGQLLGEVDQTAAAAQHLHVVGNLSVIDGDLQLTIVLVQMMI